MQLELRTRHDDRASRIVNALAEKVLAEPALLALEHVGQRLQRALVGTRDDAAATAVVEQSIDRLLKHALLVADDDSGRTQFDQPLQAVVAVDDAAIEIVQVGRREAAAVQRDERAQIRRDHRDDLHDHPFRTIAGFHEVLDDLQPLEKLLLLQLGRGRSQFGAQVTRDPFQFHRGEELVDRLGADHGGEGILAILVHRKHVLFLGEELVLLQRGEAWLGDDVVLEIEDALDVLQRHVEQRADARRQRLQEPDMRDGSSQLDVAHALAADAREGNLDAALLADDALVLHALVLAAQALVVLDRAEDARAEETVTFRLERAVVDRLRLLDLAERPGQDLFRACQRDPDRIEDLRRRLRVEKIHDLLVHVVLLWGSADPFRTCRNGLAAPE